MVKELTNYLKISMRRKFLIEFLASKTHSENMVIKLVIKCVKT